MKTPIFQGSSKDKIFKALAIYNNGYASEKIREEAMDILLEEFADQLGQAREEEMIERWYTFEDLEQMRGTPIEAERESEHLFNVVLAPNWF